MSKEQLEYQIEATESLLSSLKSRLWRILQDEKEKFSEDILNDELGKYGYHLHDYNGEEGEYQLCFATFDMAPEFSTKSYTHRVIYGYNTSIKKIDEDYCKDPNEFSFICTKLESNDIYFEYDNDTLRRALASIEVAREIVDLNLPEKPYIKRCVLSRPEKLETKEDVLFRCVYDILMDDELTNWCNVKN